MQKYNYFYYWGNFLIKLGKILLGISMNTSTFVLRINKTFAL